MPLEIRVMKVDFYRQVAEYQVADDIDGFISFAFPGNFVGLGETREEAMTMAKMRLRSSKKSHIDSGKNEQEWIVWASDRGAKIQSLYKKIGLKKQHVWEEYDMEKK